MNINAGRSHSLGKGSGRSKFFIHFKLEQIPFVCYTGDCKMPQKPLQNGTIRLTILAVALLVSTTLLGGVVVAQSNSNANDNANINTPPVVNDNTNVVTPPANSNTNASLSELPDPAVDQLNEQIDQKRQQIDELKRQTAIYERNLEQKQDERASLQAQVRDLGESIDQTETQLTLTQTEIEELQLEIQKVQREIAAREEEIADHREELAGLLRRLYEADQVSQLELVVQEQTFSGFFSRVQTLHSLGSSLQETLNRVLAVKERLDRAKADLQVKRQELDGKRQELESSQTVLEQQQDTKLGFLEAAQSSEQQYQELLTELKRQSASVDSEIETLIQQVNDRLAARGEDITQLKPGKLSWPVDPSRGISAYFRDPTYPFRKIFEHSAVDIRAAHGTTVTAAADGVVAIARKLDWVRNSQGKILWPAYNFVTIVHGGDIATVYGHLSEVAVTEGQTVKRGQVIGKTGGTPGTAGAGRLTTGPHIHFEVRVNGIPVDPLGYMPEL